MKKKEDREENMNAIAKRITETPAVNVAEMAMRIKTTAPTLADLNNEQLEQIARIVITQELAAELKKQVDIAGLSWQEQSETFLNYTKSEHTRRAYTAALTVFKNWTDRKGINPFELNAAMADRFIHDLKADGKATASTRRDIAAISAFYSFLERNTDGKIKNPIRGTKQRPPKESKKDIVIPTSRDYKKIIDSLPLIDRAIVITMATRGLRAGALPTLEFKSGKYHGKSKGKILKENNIAGITLPPEALEAIKDAGLDIKKPFVWETRKKTTNNANAIECRINYHIGKLYQSGKIGAAYSCHDFRHLYARNEYKKNKDIYRLSKLLNHAGIQITELYLKSLGIND